MYVLYLFSPVMMDPWLFPHFIVVNTDVVNTVVPTFEQISAFSYLGYVPRRRFAQ